MIDTLLVWASLLVIVLLLSKLKKIRLKGGWVWAIVALGFLLRLTLPNQFIAIDEMHHISAIELIRQNPLAGQYSLSGDHINGTTALAFTSPWPPGFYVMASLLNPLTAWDSATAINLIFSSVSIYLAYLVSKKLGNEYSGLAAALLMCLLPVHIKVAKAVLFEPSSVFFLLLSILLILEKSKSSPLALSLFSLIRPENFIFTIMLLLLYKNRIGKKYRMLLFTVIALSALKTINIIPIDSNWSTAVSSPLEILWHKLPRSLSYFFNISFMNPLILPLALLSKNKELIALILVSIIFYSTFPATNFLNYGEISRYSNHASVLAVIAASLLVKSKKGLVAIALSSLTFFGTLGFMTYKTEVNKMFDIISNEPAFINSDKDFVSSIPALVHAAYPRRNSMSDKNSGEFLFIDQNYLPPRKTIEDYDHCQTTLIRNHSQTRGLRFFDVSCP